MNHDVIQITDLLTNWLHDCLRGLRSEIPDKLLNLRGLLMSTAEPVSSNCLTMRQTETTFSFRLSFVRFRHTVPT